MNNSVGNNSDLSTIAGGSDNNILALCRYSAIGGGYGNAIGANCECRSERQHALGPSYGVNELVDKKFFQQLRIVLGMGSRRDVAPHLALQRVKLDRFEGGSQGICCGSHQR